MYSGEWLDTTYKERAEQLLNHFVWVNGETIKDIPIIISAENGADGVVPTEAEGRALQLAIDIGSIDQAMSFTGDKSQRIVTTDSTELQIWPLSADGFVAYPTGLMMRTTHGGWNVKRDDWYVPCPLDVYRPIMGTTLDDRLATAVYETVLKGDIDEANITERRIGIALGWWSKAWRNSVSVSWEDRIVLLKTGFEALLHDSSSYTAAKRLKLLFESAAAQSEEDITGLLWVPGETESRLHPFATTEPKFAGVLVTDLVHWFLSFAATRNKIIHDGAAKSLVYDEEGSAYNGYYVFTAERLMREALKIQLELLGHKGLWKTGLARTMGNIKQTGAKFHDI